MALEQEILREEWEDTQQGRFLTFVVDGEALGVEIAYVKEIIGVQPIARLPETPAYMKGVINLRGNIIPVIDMRLKFHKQPEEYTDRTCVIVVDVGTHLAGLIVDRVTEVLRIEQSDIVPPPEQSADSSSYIKGIGKSDGQVKLLLDTEKLLAHVRPISKKEQE